MIPYEQIDPASIPANVRFDVPRRFQGRMVEVAFGGFGRQEHDAGDPFKRITDKHDQTVRYYRLVK